MMSTLFMGLELGERDLARELVDLILSRPTEEQELSFQVLCALFRQLDRRKQPSERARKTHDSPTR
ncbi:hypothetical protein PPSIR1_21029 [Plesiocystis pacifica SIR-1]|uniref:Uncharacterized protein n=2 Tax=Plesiocystis pacifica TaxID=191768 RepID=A6G3E5_9BACT|nr:hypothetical protein PPSIR1_21029 [Plesiocystis pacifica SIR-1]